MPAPLARGIIIAASVIVAAGIAAYENPQFRDWFERSREKVAMAFQSALDDIRPPTSKRNDSSMQEDQDEKAEERRRQARQEILERGKKLEEIRRRKSKTSESASSSLNEKKSPSFDSLVDEDGKLRSSVSDTAATSSAVEPQEVTGSIRPRHTEQQVQQDSAVAHEPVDASTHSHQSECSDAEGTEPWESQYEREMRNTWNLPLPSNRTPTASTHPSESLFELTPTTEDVPDPDYSVPSWSDAGSNHLDRTEYFSIPPSHASRSATEAGSESDYYYAHPSSPDRPVQPRQLSNTQDVVNTVPGSSAASIAGSHSVVAQLSEFESDDGFSELGDGIRTPASVWTEVGSTVSGDADEDR